MDYAKVYSALIERAQTRKLEGYVEKHHIRPKCMGGTDHSSNIVHLTAREHYIAHKLLVEIYPRHKKLVYALWGMSNQISSPYNKRNYSITAREYERARTLFSQSIKGREITWRDKISKAKKGKLNGPLPLETRLKISQSNTGKKLTQAHKSAISKSMKETVKSESWKKAISDTHKQKGTKPPYRGIPFIYQDQEYPSKQAASKALGIPAYKLK